MLNQNQQTDQEKVSPNLQEYIDLIAQRHKLVEKVMKLEKEIFSTYRQALKDINDFT